MEDDSRTNPCLMDQALGLIVNNQIKTKYNVTSSVSKPFRKNGVRKRKIHENIGDTVQNIEFAYPSFCSSSSAAPRLTQVQESTTTLLAARALVKANRTEEAWSYLRSLFSVQAQNGFMPKYRYAPQPSATPPNTENENDSIEDVEKLSREYYYKNTVIPTEALFNKNSMPRKYLPCPREEDTEISTSTSKSPSTCFDYNGDYTFISEINVTSSGRLAALPMHASSILDMFYLSNQTRNDVYQLSFYFERVYKMHYYWMEHVMRHCRSYLSIQKDVNNTHNGSGRDGGNSRGSLAATGPCYNIIHPWESMVDMNSPQWNEVLKYTIKNIDEKKWKPEPEMIPDHVRYSTEFPQADGVYNAMLYILECHANITVGKNGQQQSRKSFAAGDDYLETKNGSDGGSDYERKLIQQCPFAMLDLSHLAILTRSNYDLYEIGKILYGSHFVRTDIPSKTQLSTVKEWVGLTEQLMEEELWDEAAGEGRYSSKNIEFIKNDTASYNGTRYDWNGSNFLFGNHDSVNLMAGWNFMTNSTRFANSVVGPLMDRGSDYSFNCGSYPIWSWACTSNDETGLLNYPKPSVMVSPLKNYLISTGLIRNSAEGLGNYVQQSTLQLMCSGRDEFGNFPIMRNCNNLTFANAFNAHTTLPLANSTYCDMTSTSAAAVAVNLLLKDKAFSFKPTPPIRNDWIIVLIVAEIMIAFSIGVSCFILSLNLMRRLKKDADEGELLQLARENDRTEENVEVMRNITGEESIRSRLGSEDSDGDAFPVLIWKFLHHINPFY